MIKGKSRQGLGSRCFCISTPYCERGCLPQWLATFKPDAICLRRVLAEVPPALVFSHSRGLRRGDVTPENILIACDGQAKLADFDASVDWKDDLSPARNLGASLRR